MCYRRSPAAHHWLFPLPLACLLLLGACASRRVEAPRRLAVLPFENLTPDSNLDWLGTASSTALVSDLAGLRRLYPFRAGSVGSAYADRASEVLEASFEFTGDRLQVHASLEDLARHEIMRQFSVVGPARQGILPLVNQLAGQVDSGAHAFSTHDPAAFRSFGQALSSADPAVQARLLQTASVQDPGFTASYMELSEALLLRGDRADAAQVAAAGARHAPNPVDRARLEYVSAATRGDLQGRENALAQLSRLTPADPDALRKLAQVRMLERKYSEAVRDLEAAARIDPGDPATFNLLGYTRAYAHDLEGARQSLTAYRKLAPEGDLNPIDSLGEVSFFLGDFPAAERWFLEAHQRNPGIRGGFELSKAAQARLMTGDLKGADAIYARYLDFRKGENRVANEYQRGQWEWLTGRRKQGLERTRNLLPLATGDTAALLGAQLSIWNLQIGGRAEAARLAQQAAAQAVTPGAKSLTALCLFLAAPNPRHSGNNLADAYALLLQGRFADAVAPLQALYRETPPESDGQVRTLLAWAYSKTGRIREAAGLTELYPLPIAGNDALFASLTFPRFLQVRSAVLDSQGKHEEAQRLGRLYREYSGGLPDQL